MLRNNILSLTLASAMVAACGGDDSTGGDGSINDGPGNGDAGHDAGHDAGTTTGSDTDAGSDAGTGAVLKSGTYDVSNVKQVSDECQLDLVGGLADNSFKTLQLINDSTTLSIGTHYDDTTPTKWVPAGYGLGTGKWPNAQTVTLMANPVVTFDDGCSYTAARTTVVNYVDTNKVDVDYTAAESNHNSSCKAPADNTKNCTSHFTFTLTRSGD